MTEQVSEYQEGGGCLYVASIRWVCRGALTAQGFCMVDLHFILINILAKGKYFSALSHLGQQTAFGFLGIRKQRERHVI